MPQEIHERVSGYQKVDTRMLNGTRTNSLLFVDNLAMFSLLPEVLQNKIDILQNYFRKWGLEMSNKKTK